MIISVNNKPLELSSTENINSVLRRLQFNQAKGIAVAINNKVVPKSSWEDHLVKENDNITIIRATQGG
jgi:sulfur carrier protein